MMERGKIAAVQEADWRDFNGILEVSDWSTRSLSRRLRKLKTFT